LVLVVLVQQHHQTEQAVLTQSFLPLHQLLVAAVVLAEQIKTDLRAVLVVVDHHQILLVLALVAQVHLIKAMQVE
jgi:hypothetical protein